MTTKNPKKVEAGKRLAEYNRKKREELKKSLNSEVIKSDATKKSEYNCSIIGCSTLCIVVLVGGIIYYCKNKSTTIKPKESKKVDVKEEKSKFEFE
ncbi:MAG: hypothetical protein J4F36_14530 [Nitrosopumilaceae archaeon]|nr:hypothetical protein [Nitrosopumilaceae archaeon]